MSRNGHGGVRGEADRLGPSVVAASSRTPPSEIDGEAPSSRRVRPHDESMPTSTKPDAAQSTTADDAPDAPGAIDSTTATTAPSWRWHGAIRFVSAILLIASVLILINRVDVARIVEVLEQWQSSLGVATPLVFAAVYVVAAVILLPGSAFSVASGALFGFWLGLAVSIVASTVAGLLAFLVARHLLRDTIARRAARFPRFAAVDRAIGRDGGTVVLLLRVVPGFPFSIGNYLFGLTSVRLAPYVAATFVGMLPSTTVFVLAGAAGRRSLAALTHSATPSPLQLFGLLVVAVILIAAMVVVATRAKRMVIERLRLAQAELNELNGSSDDTELEPALPPSTLTTTLTAIAAILIVITTLLAR